MMRTEWQMDPLTKNIALVFLVTTMAAIGLKVTIDELGKGLANHSLMVRALVVNIIIAPLLGLLLVRIFPVSANAATGILLLATATSMRNATVYFIKERKSREA